MDVPDRIDVAFSVPFAHRVRFTADVLGEGDDGVLLDVLGTANEPPARVLACVETGVDAAADAGRRVRALAGRHAARVELVDVLVLDGGERVKNDPAALLPVLTAIRDGNLDRRSYVLAIGGGAFLDAVGFAAAIAHRGVRLVRLPTTTLGQADSGVGVKNAVNFFGRKNWVGTFAVPRAVINDAALLSTLGDRDYRCGFAEAVKVALVRDGPFFDQLCHEAPRIADRDVDAGGRAIRRSAFLHLSHVTGGGDPFETLEARPLDFGHWSAHRLEAMTGFALRHGEAVAIGLAIDCAYSRLALGLPAEAERRVRRCLADLRLPVDHPALANTDALLAGLEEFRQHLGGRLTVTMLRDVGRPVDVHAIDEPTMRRAIASVRGAGEGPS
jgi:3-dehydroquinate synthase